MPNPNVPLSKKMRLSFLAVLKLSSSNWCSQNTVLVPVLGTARRCWRTHRDFEDMGEDLKQLMLSGKARVTNRIINLMASYADEFSSLSVVRTLHHVSLSVFTHVSSSFQLSKYEDE